MFDFLSTDELRAFIRDQSQVLDLHTKGIPETSFENWAVAMATAIHHARVELSRRQRLSLGRRPISEVAVESHRRSPLPGRIEFVGRAPSVGSLHSGAARSPSSVSGAA